MKRKIVVASYNIRQCVGLDGVKSASRIRAVLSEIDADVIGLQEVASEADDGDAGSLEALASELGMTPVAGPTMKRTTSGYGNGVLTRLEVQQVLRHDLSIDGYEPRGALEVVVRVSGSAVAVLNTHLGLRRSERRRQAGLLLRRISDIRTPVVVMGDFNEWTRYGRFGRAMDRLAGASRGPRTFPSHRPIVALDRIWARPAGRLGRTRALRTKTARVASDHLPVVATLDLAPQR